VSGDRRALAASVTPLDADGIHVDAAAVPGLVDFYAASGLDGLLVLGTTGEGVLLSVAERCIAADAFLAAAQGRLEVFVHCGAQSTADTVTLARHAARAGAHAVAVIAPPYYAFDERSLTEHFVRAADAAAPSAFFVYEFAQRSGYAVPLAVVETLRARAQNFAGMKVSDSPFDLVEPYMGHGLDVFVGAEELIAKGLTRGAVGAVSGLAAALPEAVVRAVRSAAPEDSAVAGRLRAMVQRFPFQAALKRVLRHRGVSVLSTVAAPLRDLDAAEAEELDRLLTEPGGLLAQSTTVSVG